MQEAMEKRAEEGRRRSEELLIRVVEIQEKIGEMVDNANKRLEQLLHRIGEGRE
jgi:hypothetical protein